MVVGTEISKSFFNFINFIRTFSYILFTVCIIGITAEIGQINSQKNYST